MWASGGAISRLHVAAAPVRLGVAHVTGDAVLSEWRRLAGCVLSSRLAGNVTLSFHQQSQLGLWRRVVQTDLPRRGCSPCPVDGAPVRAAYAGTGVDGVGIRCSLRAAGAAAGAGAPARPPAPTYKHALGQCS